MNQHVIVRSAMERLLAEGGCGPASGIRSIGGPGGGAAGAPLHHLEAGAGRAVVLLHGGSGGGANWFRVIAPLAAGHRVLAPDLPGFGLSPRPADGPARDGVPPEPLGRAAARVLHEWLVRSDVRRAVVVGTSFGGIAALRLAQRAPDLVAGLLLLDSAGLGRGIHPLVRLATVPGLTRLGVRPSRRGTAALFRSLLTRDRSELDAATEAALIAYLHASAVAAGTDYLAATLRRFASPAGQREVIGAAELNALAVPVTFVWGERDSFLPPQHARNAARYCRDARLVIVPGAGHSPNWERPAPVIDAILDLLDRCDG